MAKKLKKVSAHDDYTLNQMISLLRSQVFVITSYFQSKFPYGEEYNKAFEQYQDTLKQIDRFEDALAVLVESEKENNYVR